MLLWVLIFLGLTLLVIITAIKIIKQYLNKQKISIKYIVINISAIVIILLLFLPIFSSINKIDISNLDIGEFTGDYENNSNNWDHGFNTAWAGTYLSRADADYYVRFQLGTNGRYAFRYGENYMLSTRYVGNYNGNFKNGISNSGLNYRITEIKVIGFDENLIRLAVDWDNPGGKHTDYFILYLR